MFVAGQQTTLRTFLYKAYYLKLVESDIPEHQLLIPSMLYRLHPQLVMLPAMMRMKMTAGYGTTAANPALLTW